ncbi:hypothetical protein CHGG_07186 [Chaetomium globosum CBS 148.51]|uniref:Gamma-glutamyltranspeptidase n=1 Tax=Chaetomium globosum (strain ATCC 6205 / CBS 148.51 / DSM 1962 / NBRC 6347 / NRRL 1970) TaxID=306901 RepID=Q2GXW8_CHAGB|nr:uncharacterized protein CHGG_07186 [Chaetomium globosum CBS 148.51]EAQ85933.1 hypothetical protein CHGG_07186 [Chaetomium globosum CBS 148.51]
MPLTTPSVYPPACGEFLKWPSRRSVVHSTKGMVACTQPLAAKCGIDILNAGGNAADAAVAVAAGLNITEPTSTGIGGDMFCLYYDAKTGKVSALNGSGRSGGKCTLETIRKDLGLADDELGEMPMNSVHAATVPGAAAGWVDTVERFGSGKLSMEQILAPAIELAEKGFPVSEDTAFFWKVNEAPLRKASPNFAEMLKADPSAPDGVRAPKAGDIMKMPNLARTFRTLATEGKKGFYTGRIAEEIIKVVRDRGGHLELADLAHHLEQGSEPVDPISLKFRGQGCGSSPRSSPGGGGVELWEHPPNGQGIVALMALGIFQELEASGQDPHLSPPRTTTPRPTLHAHHRMPPPSPSPTRTGSSRTPPPRPSPSASLISQPYLASRAKLFNPSATTPDLTHGNPNPNTFPSPALRSSDTVYFAAADSAGNAISFINSNYAGFGSAHGAAPAAASRCRTAAANFSLTRGHPNVLAPRKRPYHTIIPGLVTCLGEGGDGDGPQKGELHSVFGVMGGFMQPQGHVQVLLGQIVGALNPQQALDAPRVCIGAGMADVGDVYSEVVYVEEGMPEATVEGLRKLGHPVKVLGGWGGMGRQMFGRGQIVRWTVDEVEGTGVWSGGSDMRGDGAAYPA